MILRSKVKRRKTEKQNSEEKRESLGANAGSGASYLKYEIIEKKDGKKSLVPIRYSIRNKDHHPDT